MAIQKTVQTIIWDGDTVTASGEASIPVDNSSWESSRNMDGSLSRKYVPSDEPATFSLRLDTGTRKVLSRTKKTIGWGINVYFRDGTSVQIGDCSVENNPQIDGDGSVDVDVMGNVQWL